MATETKVPDLTADERAVRVLASQGKAPVMLATLKGDELDRLAALCDADGTIADGVRERIDEWFDRYRDARMGVKPKTLSPPTAEQPKALRRKRKPPASNP